MKLEEIELNWKEYFMLKFPKLEGELSKNILKLIEEMIERGYRKGYSDGEKNKFPLNAICNCKCSKNPPSPLLPVPPAPLPNTLPSTPYKWNEVTC